MWSVSAGLPRSFSWPILAPSWGWLTLCSVHLVCSYPSCLQFAQCFFYAQRYRNVGLLRLEFCKGKFPRWQSLWLRKCATHYLAWSLCTSSNFPWPSSITVQNSYQVSIKRMFHLFLFACLVFVHMLFLTQHCMWKSNEFVLTFHSILNLWFFSLHNLLGYRVSM